MTREACEVTAEVQVPPIGERSAEAALIDSARQGDGLAFEQLHARYRNRIYTLLLNLCGDREEAHDLLQEAFLRAWRGLRGFRGRSEFSTWLYQIALNAGRDALRRRRAAPSPPEPVIGGDAAIRERVRTALGHVQPSYREALVLRYTEELSYQEIADHLDWSLPQVKMTLYRAKLAFRQAYLQLEESET